MGDTPAKDPGARDADHDQAGAEAGEINTREHIPDDDEYTDLMESAVEAMKDADLEHLWASFDDWVDNEAEKGPWNRYEVKAGVFLYLGGSIPSWRRKTLPKARAAIESAFFGEYLPKQSRDAQVDALAEMWRAADKHDTRSRQLFGWVKEMENKGESREEIARTMQAALDSYRAGEPLKMKDRVTLLAHKHLPEKTRIRTMAAALKKNGSKAQNHEEKAAQMYSKANDECADPLPHTPDLDGTSLKLHETYPLIVDMIRHLRSRGIIRDVTFREHWKFDDWDSEEARANAAAHHELDALVAEVDPEYPALDDAFYSHANDRYIQRVADPEQVADPQQVDDAEKVADPEQENPQVADPQQR